MRHKAVVSPKSSTDAARMLKDAISLAERASASKTLQVLLREYAELVALKYDEELSIGVAVVNRLRAKERRSRDPEKYRQAAFEKALDDARAMRETKICGYLPNPAYVAAIVLSREIWFLETTPKIRAIRAEQKKAKEEKAK